MTFPEPTIIILRRPLLIQQSLNSPVLSLCTRQKINYYNFIVIIICDMGSHSEHKTNVLTLTCLYISLLFALYKNTADGLVN
jgi:hypothetical protein